MKRGFLSKMKRGNYAKSQEINPIIQYMVPLFSQGYYIPGNALSRKNREKSVEIFDIFWRDIEL
jgi:hypothetical protein